MTFLEVNYRYRGPLGAAQLKRLGELAGHYGIRRIRLDEERSMARIEFDASRLKESEVVHWVRRAGIPLLERVAVDRPAA
ncbi:MAG: hypothetical protein ACRD4D_07045 [Candidatus Acidiferrales bacterium]